MLSLAAQKGQIGGQWFSALLLVNVVGIIILLLFVVANFFRLLRQYQKRVMGSRLMMRLVALFLLLTCLPIGVVYYFSAQFLSKGVDSWFDVKIEQALGDALLLGQGFLEASKDDLLSKAREDALQIGQASDNIERIRLVGQIRQQRAYVALDLYSSGGQVIATSNLSATTLVPDAPEKPALDEVRSGGTVAKLEPNGNSLQYRILVPVTSRSLTGQTNVLQVIEPLPLRYARLGDSLELASSEYNRLSYLRKPLKVSFLISLSLITIMTVLISLWLALFAARRLVAPLRDLAEGTRLVATGDYHTRLPVKSDDELGSLVGSFNTMISQIRRSQGEAEANHLKEINQRAYLQTVLSHLSSGVLSFNDEQALQTTNEQASSILDTPLQAHLGKSCHQLEKNAPHTAALYWLIDKAMQGAEVKQQEISLESQTGKQILLVTVTRLSTQVKSETGWVVVFDDVTNLVNAQRDAAWGEVARRLAHEIKNPLTPIQLSAERIRRKYLNQLDLVEREALDRSTRTISEQVDTLKRMVDAFSNYARSDRLHFSGFDICDLITDCSELNRPLEGSVNIKLKLEKDLPLISADRDAIRQVLNNLFGNAIEACQTSKGSLILVSAQLQSHNGIDGIAISINDDGQGFDEAMLDKVFEPYVTNKDNGTGLGMAIVKRIVDAHRGFVRAYNRSGEAATRGGCVELWLPQKAHDEQ